MREGLTFLVCTHNGAARLPATLRHLAQQRGDIEWEVVLVDNASTDDSAEVARRVWAETAPAPLRVLRENRIGKSRAFFHGVDAARFPYITIVDDDNWLAPDFLQIAVRRMREDSDIGALGARGVSTPETALPPWFDSFSIAYAVAPAEWTMAHRLYGAGLTLRRAALDSLARSGFRPILEGPRGRRDELFASGEDNELVIALEMAGWRAVYEPRLRFQHFLPAARLRWAYLRRLMRASGAATVVYDAYHSVAGGIRRRKYFRVRSRWGWQALVCLARLSREPRALRAWWLGETSLRAILVDIQLGRLAGLLRARGNYARWFGRVREVDWTTARLASRRHSIAQSAPRPPLHSNGTEIPECRPEA